MGFGSGRGFGRRSGRGRGGGFGMGAGGYCICPSCGERVLHQQGMPCYQTRCPKCGAYMTRDFGGTPISITRQSSQVGRPTIPRQRPYVLEERCTGCGECIAACPFHSITIVNGKAHIDEESCRHCGVCTRACPQGAIVY